MVLTACPSLRSRTVPMKLQTAPTRLSCARRAAISALTSKSAVWIETRLAMSASCHRRKESDFAAFAQGRGFIAHHLIQRHAHRAAAGQALGMAAAAGDQLV